MHPDYLETLKTHRAAPTGRAQFAPSPTRHPVSFRLPSASIRYGQSLKRVATSGRWHPTLLWRKSLAPLRDLHISCEGLHGGSRDARSQGSLVRSAIRARPLGRGNVSAPIAKERTMHKKLLGGIGIAAVTASLASGVF